MTKSNNPITFKKSFESDPELLPQIEDFVFKSLIGVALTDKQKNNLSLSIAEAASNAIIHGNNADIDKLVEVIVKRYSDKVEIIFKDQGEGFDLKDIPDPTLPENILNDSGRGIYIMRNFLDDVKFNFTPTGTETILTLKLN